MQRLLLNRRQACKLFGSVPILAGAEEAAPKTRNGHMFLALNSVLLTNRVKSWPDFAKLAAATGFPGVDVMLQQAEEAGPENTINLLKDLKIGPAVIEFPVEFRKDDAAFQASLPKLKKAGPFAAKIGCPRMMTYIMSSSVKPKEEQRRIYKERFTESAKILAESEVRLGLEFLGPLHIRKQFPHEFIWRMDEMLEFAQECGPNVGLLLDSWHWHHAGATPEDILKAGRERIVHVHFNDAPNLPPEQIRDNQRLLPGEGVINLTGFLQALQKIGYTDALSVEVFGRLKDVPVEQAAKMGLDSALAVFRKAGVPER